MSKRGGGVTKRTGRNSEEINGFLEVIGQHAVVLKEAVVLNYEEMAASQNCFLTCDEITSQRGKWGRGGREIQC